MERANTSLSGSGAHEAACPFASRWQRLRTGWPSTPSNAPPTYQPPAPSGSTARTTPGTLANGSMGWAVTGSNGTAQPVLGPIRLNCPAMYSVPPIGTTADTGPIGTHSDVSGACARAATASARAKSGPREDDRGRMESLRRTPEALH